MRQPLRLALWLSLGYFAVALTYILFSGGIAARYAETVAELQRIEKIKGAAFVVVSGLLLFIFAFFLFRKLALHERSLTDYRDNLLTANHRAAAGLFASSVAHDINNILMVIEHVTDELDEAPEHERSRLMRTLTTANDDLKRLIARLGTARSSQKGNVDEEFDLVGVARRVMDLLESHRKARGCHFLLEKQSELRIRGRSALVHQMFLNLLLNAADATGGKGTVEVKLIVKGNEILVEVHDNGPGVPVEDRERIMDPLISTKPDGCGLGLLSVQACAEAHGGKVEIEDSHLGGACFRVRLQSSAAGGSRISSGKRV